MYELGTMSNSAMILTGKDVVRCEKPAQFVTLSNKSRLLRGGGGGKGVEVTLEVL
jgi:hypothetical protein